MMQNDTQKPTQNLSSKQSAPKQSTPKQSAPKQSAPKQSAPKQSAPKQSAPKQSAPKQSDPKQSAFKAQKILPSSFILRLSALIVDFIMIALLALLFSLVATWITGSFFGIHGMFVHWTQLKSPMAFIAFLYFLPETSTNGKSLGKALLGLEIRSDQNQKQGELYLWLRYFLKMIPPFMIFASQMINLFLYEALTVAILVVYLFSYLAILSQSHQSWYDQISSSAVFQAKSKVYQSVQAAAKSKKQGLSKGKLAETPNALQYPCAVELKLFCIPAENRQEKLFDFFMAHATQFNENQLVDKGTKGKYSIFKVIARFDQPDQMETAYQAMREDPDIVMLLPKKAVKLSGKPKATSQSSTSKKPTLQMAA
jgi:putative lipoic acid-binding regulatory protein/uncharacterized RDD family membrane protein YckC